jgi:benzoyl-CoA reductase/2-hydroxyglutaryl-CoA dehydratase subunit BcrC/BadD/HgdB
MGDFPQRWAHLQQRARAARVDGVVFQRLLFCDPWGADQHNLMYREKGSNGPPVLYLTREYGTVPTGQLRTRMQAFLERLEVAGSNARRATHDDGA